VNLRVTSWIRNYFNFAPLGTSSRKPAGTGRPSSPIDTARQAEPFWNDYEIDAHLFDDFFDDWLIKRIVLELRV
jgi:hypothetical protein